MPSASENKSDNFPITFLSLPLEIRRKVYILLFTASAPLKIEPANPIYQNTDDTDDVLNDSEPPQPWRTRMSPLQICRPAYLSTCPPTSNYMTGLTSQLLHVCQKVHSEALPILYTSNEFDCSMRSAPAILPHVISTANFALIRHLILDWEQLQDFAWSLAKDDQVQATRGLTVLELNHFRTRMMRPRAEHERMGITPDPSLRRPSQPQSWNANTNSWLYEDTKSHERQLHQAALEICQKHAQLRFVLQATAQKRVPRGYQREDIPPGGGAYSVSRPIPELKVTARIRWRFVTTKGVGDKRADEEVLDLPLELEALSGPSRGGQQFL